MAGTAVLERVTWRGAKVVAVQDETATARTLVLAVRDWPGQVAGQHVDVRLTAPDGYSAVRSYSIASSPSSDGRIEITVERLPNGEVSPYLTQEVMVGDELELRGPIGGWFVWQSDQMEPIQLVAGGSGIVPLMAMIRSRLSTGNSAPFRLLYSVSEPAAVFYRDELLAFIKSRRLGSYHLRVHASDSEELAAARRTHRRSPRSDRCMAFHPPANQLCLRPDLIC